MEGCSPNNVQWKFPILQNFEMLLQTFLIQNIRKGKWRLSVAAGSFTKKKIDFLMLYWMRILWQKKKPETIATNIYKKQGKYVGFIWLILANKVLWNSTAENWLFTFRFKVFTLFMTSLKSKIGAKKIQEGPRMHILFKID